MRILVFSPYYPPHTGGLESHSDEFNKYLSQQGIDITVFTPHLPKESPQEEVLYGKVRIIRFPAFEIVHNFPCPSFWKVIFWKLFLRLLRERYDVVITRTRFFISSFMGGVYAKITHTRWIHIEHGSDFVKLSSPIKTLIARIYDYTFGFLIFRLSDVNIAISRAVHSFVMKFDKRFTPVIYRGMDFEALDKIKKDETILEQYKGKIIMCTAARLYKWKGIEFTIEAIRKLDENLRSKIVFLVIGDGEDFNHLKNLSKSLPVKMLGNLKRDAVVSILKASDIYIHSSLPGGGLSTSLLEAMYSKCAVLATKNEGADEVIQNNLNGILVDGIRSEHLIFYIQDEAKRKSISENAKTTISEKFSWNISAEKYLSLFKRYES